MEPCEKHLEEILDAAERAEGDVRPALRVPRPPALRVPRPPALRVPRPPALRVPGALSTELAEHLAGCARCARALEELREAIGEFRSFPLGRPRADLADRALEAIGRQGQEAVRGKSRRVGWALLGAAAAVLLAAASLLVFFSRERGRTDRLAGLENGTLTAVTEKAEYHGKGGPDDQGPPPKIYYAIDFRLSGKPAAPSSFFDIVREGRKVGYGEVTVRVSELERRGRAWALPREKIQPGDGIVLREQEEGDGE